MCDSLIFSCKARVYPSGALLASVANNEPVLEVTDVTKHTSLLHSVTIPNGNAFYNTAPTPTPPSSIKLPLPKVLTYLLFEEYKFVELSRHLST